MTRFIGYRNNQIYVVSDFEFDCSDFSILKLNSELSDIPVSDLITDYKVKNNQVVKKRVKKLAKELKIALVGNWKMSCGIAEYNLFLWQKVVPYLGEFKLFVEKNDSSTESIYKMGDETLAINQVDQCWERGESLQELVQKIKDYDPDIIWIGHEFGLFPNARYWLSFLSQLSDYRIIVTMHSIFHHKDKTICEAVIPEIITHLEGGRQILKEEKQISSSVYVIPHGCHINNNDRLWNFYKSEHTIIQAGFLFRYKGWEESIKTIGILKKKYNDVFFTGICSESSYSKVEHQIYYNELVELIEELDIKENVALIRGYQSDQVLDSYFKTNKIAVFPYTSNQEHEVFGASGAARLAMSKGLLVISSMANHFQDLPTIKAASPKEMAAEVEKVFLDQELYRQQIIVQNSYLEENSWEKVALKHIEIFENPPTH